MGDVAEISVKNKCELLQARELSQLYKYGELSFFLKKTMNLNKSGPVHMLYLEAARADVITGDATEARTSRKEGREKGGAGVFRRERASDPRRRAARARISVLRL